MKAYIIHVSDDFARERHINNQLKDKDLEIEFILEGDIKDLTEDILTNLFDMEFSLAYISCTYKHLLSYKKVIAGSDEVALVLEDDINLSSNFDAMLGKLMAEIKERKLSNFLISLEDSMHEYIPRSKRIKGQLIYPADHGRTAGAYLIDKKGAMGIWDEVNECKVTAPTDWFHNICVKKKRLGIYWSQPTIAIQGSLNGQMNSHLSGQEGTLDRIENASILRVLSVKLQRFYKKILYEFR